MRVSQSGAPKPRDSLWYQWYRWSPKNSSNGDHTYRKPWFSPEHLMGSCMFCPKKVWDSSMCFKVRCIVFEDLWHVLQTDVGHGSIDPSRFGVLWFWPILTLQSRFCRFNLYSQLSVGLFSGVLQIILFRSWKSATIWVVESLNPQFWFVKLRLSCWFKL
jgi:hypothetical protein